MDVIIFNHNIHACMSTNGYLKLELWPTRTVAHDCFEELASCTANHDRSIQNLNKNSQIHFKPSNPLEFMSIEIGKKQEKLITHQPIYSYEL